MILHRAALMMHLKRLGIITNSGKVGNRFMSRLIQHPDVAAAITTYTSFLQYSAPMRVRIQCIIQGIAQQPTCKTCGCVTHMRETGKWCNTFPTYCSSGCAAKDPFVQGRRIKSRDLCRP